MNAMTRTFALATMLSLSGCIFETSIPGAADLDRVPPHLSAFTVSAPSARIGASVSLRFTTNEPLPPEHRGRTNPIVTFAGQPALCAEETGGQYVCSTMVSASMGEGPGQFEVTAFDGAGNSTGKLIPEVIAVLDFTPPTLSVVAGPNPAGLGAAITFVVNASEPLGAAPGVAADFLASGALVACSGTVPGQTFSCTGATVSPTASEGEYLFTASAIDLAGNEAVSAPGSVVLRAPADLPPVVTVESVEPRIVGEGRSFTVVLSSPAPFSSCTVTVGAKRASCAAPADGRCTCVSSATAEVGSGVVGIIATATNSNGTGTNADSVLQVDRLAPSFDPGKVRILRRPVGTLEQLEVDPGGLFDRTDDDIPYAPAAGVSAYVAEARLMASESPSGPARLDLVVASDASIARVDIPASDLLADKRYWLRLVDAAGNVGMVEIASSRDLEAPTVDGAALATLRRPIGELDSVVGSAGAVVDSGCAAASVRVFDSATGTEVGRASIANDGSFAGVSVGSADSAPPRTFVRAADKCGNVTTTPLEVVAGRDLTGPLVNSSALRFVRRALTAADAISGDVGSITDSGCAPRKVELYDTAPAGFSPQGTKVAEAAVLADGSFAPADFGSASQSLPRAWAFARDKCDNRGIGVEVGVGADTTGPTWDRGALTYVRRPRGTDDSASASVGAVTDSVSAVAAVRLLSPDGAELVASFAPAADGSFSPRVIGDFDHAEVMFEARDKAGNTSQRVSARRIDAVFNLRGKAPYDEQITPMAAYSVASDLDPLTVSPGYAPTQVPELTMPGAAGVEGEGMLFETIATSDTGAGPAGWWRTLVGSTSMVSTMDRPAVTYDSLRERLVMFHRGESWEFRARDWERIRIGGPSLVNASIAYDKLRDRIVLFGGQSASGRQAATWEFDGTTWREMPLTSSPPARIRAAMAFDASLGQIVLFGGEGGSGLLGDTWKYDGLAWTVHGSGGTPPSARASAGIAYDATRGGLVLFGGQTGAAASAETFTLVGNTWAPAPSPLLPPARSEPGLTYDSRRGTIFLFAGRDGSTLRGDLWELTAAGWTERVLSPRPSARTAPAFSDHPALGSMVLFGGRTSDTSPTGLSGEQWTLDGTGWKSDSFNVSGSQAPAELGFDLRRDRKVFSSVPYLGALVLNEQVGARWIATSTPVPDHEGTHSAWDARRGALFFQGGKSFGASTSSAKSSLYADGVLTTVASGPPADILPIAYDATRGKVVALSRIGGSATWEWDGTWTNRTDLAVQPPARFLPALGYDARRGRIVLFGGRNALDSAQVFDDTWEYDGTAWREVTLSSRPSPRAGARFVQDPVSGRMLMYGGSDLQPYTDVWEFDGTSWTASSIQVPDVNAGRLIADPLRAELYLLSWERFRTTHVLSRATAHARRAALVTRLPLGAGTIAQSISARHVGYGSGSGGSGARLHIWKGRGGSAGWTQLGAHTQATPTAIDAAVTGTASEYPLDGYLWLMASSATESGLGTASRLFTDYVELRVVYLVP